MTRSPAIEVETKSAVWDHWRGHAERTPDREAIVHLTAGEEPRRWRWGELVRTASQAARWLADHGVRKGDVCALVVRHHPHFYPLYMGVSALGALPAVLAYPNARLHPDKFRQGLEGMSRRSGLDHIVTESDLAEVVRPLVAGRQSTIRQILHPLEWLAASDHRRADLAEHAPASPDEPCLLQHSSGTTGLQKAVVLSHRAVLEHVRRYGEAIAIAPSDKVVSWLPLYHDMGLIAAFYLPLVWGIPLVQLSPLEWVSAPALLAEAISRERATLCWQPNFAYNLMADRVRDEDLEGVRLDSIRLLVNCAEAVRAESHDRFHEKYGRFGLRRAAFSACYAMAETTFAVTQTPPGREARRLAVDRAELARGRVVPVAAAAAGARVCVSSGVPISGCQVRALDDERRDVGAGVVGEIAISSVSLFDGYRNLPEKTAEVMHQGEYLSGDYGFVHEGECFVIGRKKDLIIVAGNNIFPEDVEDAVSAVPGIAPGRVVAFGLEDEGLGTEIGCVVAETEAAAEPERKALRRAVVEAGLRMDVTLSRVYLAPPRWLIKSSAGKPARAANRTRALAELDWK